MLKSNSSGYIYVFYDIDVLKTNSLGYIYVFYDIDVLKTNSLGYIYVSGYLDAVNPKLGKSFRKSCTPGDINLTLTEVTNH